jgi:hypothetical protein
MASSLSQPSGSRGFGLRSGELEPEWSRHLVESSDDRLAADYDAETIFPIQDAEYECQRTGAFVDRVRSYLLSKGFRGEELAM